MITYAQTQVKFEVINTLQDGKKRVGRLILFKECQKYYRGLQNWLSEKGWLNDSCLAAQDKFKKYPDYFRIPC